MFISSDNFPEVKRLQGQIIVPYFIHENTREDENGETKTEYCYLEYRETDVNQDLPDTTALRNIVYSAVEAELHAHIFSVYPVASQTSILGHSMKAQLAERSDIVTACEAIQTWCSGCVGYFRTILQATYAGNPLEVTWNFEENCPLTEGLATLGDIEDMWS
jgi:hypothetical protein